MKRKFYSELICFLCIEYKETNLHLFLHCPITRAILFKIQGIQVEQLLFQNAKDIIIYCVFLYHQFKQNGLLMVLTILIVADEIWKLRNSLRLGHRQDIQIYTLIVMVIIRFHCHAVVIFNSSLSPINASTATKNDQL